MQEAPPSYSDATAPPPVNPMYPNPPAQGYQVPKKGYPDPQQGYAPPQQGYQVPEKGYPDPQQGYAPPQQGFAPQQGYQVPQQGYAPPQLLTYQPQAGYPPPQQAPQYTTPVATQQPQVRVVTVTSSFGSTPQRITCVNCRTEQMTITSRRLGAMNWFVCCISALVILFLTCMCGIPILFMPFVLVALCIPSLMDTVHVCPNCRHLNGIHRVAKIRILT